MCSSERLSEAECGSGAWGWQILMRLVITQILYIHESADKKKQKKTCCWNPSPNEISHDQRAVT